MARYMERAENLARLLEVGHRLAITPGDTGGNEWLSTVTIAGCSNDFFDEHNEAAARSVTDFLGLSEHNSYSIPSCIANARANGRAVRTALTSSMWECLNGTWLDLETRRRETLSGTSVVDYLDWIKDRSQQFTGAITSTMLRNDAYYFTQMGTLLERADNTARILDVKYHVLLPEHEAVGGGLDFYQWNAILRAVTANRAYHYLYRDSLQPWLIAEMLILRAELPRSLVGCLAGVTDCLERLSNAYGARKDCVRMANALHADLAYGKIEDIFQQGLHEFLTDFLRRNYALADQIQRDYLL